MTATVLRPYLKSKKKRRSSQVFSQDPEWLVRSTAPKTGTQAIDLTSQRFSFKHVIRYSDRTAGPRKVFTFILSLVFTFFI